MFLYILYRRKRETAEEKAKVFAAVWGKNLFNSLLRQLFCLRRFWIIGWIAPGWFERKGWIHLILLSLSFFYATPSPNLHVVKIWRISGSHNKITDFFYFSLTQTIWAKRYSTYRETSNYVKTLLVYIYFIFADFFSERIRCNHASCGSGSSFRFSFLFAILLIVIL